VYWDYCVADLISCVEFNETGDLLATGDKGGRVVVFQRDQNVSKLLMCSEKLRVAMFALAVRVTSTLLHVCVQASGVAYNVYSTFQSHEPEFDYLKSIEIEEKINQIKWVHRKNNAHFLLSTNGTSALTPHLRSW
jgi:serine/threonine-protein phosphatase 2A regulatory subunit B